jgi:hypothetical protein
MTTAATRLQNIKDRIEHVRDTARSRIPVNTPTGANVVECIEGLCEAVDELHALVYAVASKGLAEF